MLDSACIAPDADGGAADGLVSRTPLVARLTAVMRARTHAPQGFMCKCKCMHVFTHMQPCMQPATQITRQAPSQHRVPPLPLRGHPRTTHRRAYKTLCQHVQALEVECKVGVRVGMGVCVGGGVQLARCGEGRSALRSWRALAWTRACRAGRRDMLASSPARKEVAHQSINAVWLDWSLPLPARPLRHSTPSPRLPCLDLDLDLDPPPPARSQHLPGLVEAAGASVVTPEWVAAQTGIAAAAAALVWGITRLIKFSRMPVGPYVRRPLHPAVMGLGMACLLAARPPGSS